MSGIFFVEPGYVPGPVNPITGKHYEHGWICLRLTNEAEYEVFCSGRELYCAAISKQNPGWKYRVMDFVEYSLAQGKDVIVSGERADYAAARKAYAGHHHKDRSLRPHETRVMVHSATPDGYPSIVRMGALKSRRLLIQEGVIAIVVLDKTVLLAAPHIQPWEGLSLFVMALSHSKKIHRTAHKRLAACKLKARNSLPLL